MSASDADGKVKHFTEVEKNEKGAKIYKEMNYFSSDEEVKDQKPKRKVERKVPNEAYIRKRVNEMKNYIPLESVYSSQTPFSESEPLSHYGPLTPS